MDNKISSILTDKLRLLFKDEKGDTYEKLEDDKKLRMLIFSYECDLKYLKEENQ